jgi:cyclophilin family peptidyl-prolyl cis-trans isomerase
MQKLLLFLCLCLSGPTVFAEADTSPPHEALQAFMEEAMADGRIDKEKEGWRTRLPKFPEVSFPEGVAYDWVLDTTEGTLTFRLDPEHAPQHVRNILYLTQLGYYDGLGFHRIIPGFMAQGGCPLGRGNGGPGYTVRLEATRKARHDEPGVLSMARTAVPDSAGSQFFITFGKVPHLDGQYTVFGRITEGQEVLKAFEAAGNPDPRSNGVPPRKTITIRKAEIRSVQPNPGPDEE